MKRSSVRRLGRSTAARAGIALACGACVLLFALVGSGVAGQRTEVVEEHETVVARGERVHVRGSSGSISVTSSPDSVLRVTARKIAEGGSPASRDSLLSDLSARFEKEDGAVLVEAAWARDRRGVSGFVKRLIGNTGLGGEPHGWIDFEVRIPRGARLEANVTSGDISVKGTEGGADLAATSGEIEARGVAGALAVATTSGGIGISEIDGRVDASLASGDLALERVNGDVEADLTSGDAALRDLVGAVKVSATSGDVGLAGCAGPVDVSVTSGTVEVSGCAADVSVESSSGDVSVHAAGLGERGIHVESTSGDVAVRFPAACAARLDLESSSGAIRTEGPISLTDVSRRSLEGIVGERECAPVSVRTSSGDIEVVVERNGAPAKASRGEGAKR